jgi:hypothetical protein
MFTPPKGRCEVAGRRACKWSSIKESVLISIIDFLLIIGNLQSWKRACKDCNVARDKSDFLPFTRAVRDCVRSS